MSVNGALSFLGSIEAAFESGWIICNISGLVFDIERARIGEIWSIISIPPLRIISIAVSSSGTIRNLTEFR